MAKRAILYARVNNDDGNKLAEQLKVCRGYAESHGWRIMAELTDRMASGTSSEPTQLDRALEMARSGEFDVLIVRETSRLSRELVKLWAIKEEFRRADIQVECVLDGYDNAGTSEAIAETAKRTIVYARVSDHHEWRDGYGLARQRQVLHEYAMRRGVRLVEKAVEGGHGAL